MPLEVPNLDDRSYEDLVSSALERIQKNLHTDWNDLSPGDPGIVLLEAFAFLTEQLLYRLNRLPNKAFIAFLRMLGVSLHPPTAARVLVDFWLEQPVGEKTIIPIGTRLTSSQAEDPEQAPLFVTAQTVQIPANIFGKENKISTFAYHCTWVQGELLLAESNGQPGQTGQIKRPPIVARMYNKLDIMVGVSVDQQPAERWRIHEGKYYRLWQEVENFANLHPDAEVFMVDRQTGIIQFAPAVRLTQLLPAVETDNPDTQQENADEESESIITEVPQKQTLAQAPDFTRLGAVPESGREIRVWYARGGGETGNNVPVGSLDTVLTEDPVLQLVRVSNLQRSHSGLSAESLSNALIRGPQEVYALQRAVTAEDFERVVLHYARAVERAKAFDQASLWSFAAPGVVEIVMVPRIPNLTTADISAAHIRNHQLDQALLGLDQHLNARKTIGTRVLKKWARYKRVSVRATILVSSSEDPAKVAARLTEHLRAFMSPLALPLPEEPNQAQTTNDTRQKYLSRLYQDARPFGQPLRVAEIYQLILDTEERQVGQNSALKTAISTVEVEVEAAPNKDVRSLAVDNFQQHTWYAGSHNQVFRSTNDGAGWELLLTLSPGEQVNHFDQNEDSVRFIRLDREEWPMQIKGSLRRPGLVALLTQAEIGDTVYSSIYLTTDCGESWFRTSIVHCKVEDMVWLTRPSGDFLLLATQDGLLEVEIIISANIPRESKASAPIPIFAHEPSYPLYAVAVIEGTRGNLVAVAARGRKGVYLANSGDLLPRQAADMVNQSRINSDPFKLSPHFRYLGCVNEDIRHLSVQRLGNYSYLWAGAMARADRGKGCFRWTFNATPQLIEKSGGWVGYDETEHKQSWTGGSCYAVAFHEGTTFALTAWGGVLTLTMESNAPLADQKWSVIDREDLPLRTYELAQRHLLDQEQGSHRPTLEVEEMTTGDHSSQHIHFFLPLRAIATNASTQSQHGPIVMVGGEKGVERSLDLGQSYETASRTVFKMLKDKITIPETWLLVPEKIEIEVFHDREIAQNNLLQVTSEG